MMVLSLPYKMSLEVTMGGTAPAPLVRGKTSDRQEARRVVCRPRQLRVRLRQRGARPVLAGIRFRAAPPRKIGQAPTAGRLYGAAGVDGGSASPGGEQRLSRG
jgi:hypothetical protein